MFRRVRSLAGLPTWVSTLNVATMELSNPTGLGVTLTTMQVFAKTFYLVSQNDAEIAKQTLLNAPGIDSIEVDHTAHTVFVACANQEGLADVEARLADAGYGPEDREMAAGEVGSGAPQPNAGSG